MKYYINTKNVIYYGDRQDEDRELTCSEVEIYNKYFTIEPELEEIKAAKLKEINDVYENKSKMVKEDTPQEEVLTWDIQKIEAEGFEKDNSYQTSFIDGIALHRNIDRRELIDKILQKVRNFNNYMAEMTGVRQFYEDQIKYAKTIEEVENIRWI